MSILICIPDSMEPQALRNNLKSLDSNLKIDIGHENVKNPNDVDFAIAWNHNREGIFYYFVR